MDTRETLDLADWRQRAGDQCAEWYGKIAALRQQRYRAEVWEKLTGKTVDQLWANFAATLPKR